MFPKAPEMTPTLLPASPGPHSISWVGRLLGPADFRNVIVLRERVQVSVEVLHSACGFWMLSSGSSPFVASPAPFQKPPGLGSTCRGGASAPPGSCGFFPSFPGVLQQQQQQQDG